MKVHKLVRLRLGRSAQSGSVCERKMNVGGGNERAFLSQEAGVATKGSSLDNEGVCFLFVCFVLLLLLLFVFPNEMILALAQARSIHSVKQGSSSSEKRWRFPVLHSVCPSTVASWAKEIRDSQQSGKLTGMGLCVWPCCAVGLSTAERAGIGFVLQWRHQGQQGQVVPWGILVRKETASNSWGCKDVLLVGMSTGKRSPEWFSR